MILLLIVFYYLISKNLSLITLGEKVADVFRRPSVLIESTGNSREFTSQVLANFVVFYCTWWKDMRGSDWL